MKSKIKYINDADREFLEKHAKRCADEDLETLFGYAAVAGWCIEKAPFLCLGISVNSRGKWDIQWPVPALHELDPGCVTSIDDVLDCHGFDEFEWVEDGSSVVDTAKKWYSKYVDEAHQMLNVYSELFACD